jgi:Ca-activated chloride channel homolog
VGESRRGREEGAMILLNTTSRVIALPLLAWALLQRPAPAPPPPNHSQDYVISREVDLAVLPVTVRNREGQFVAGLNESNFRIFENGQLQTITLFQSEDTPVTIGLVVDRSGSMMGKSNEVIQGAMAFVEAGNPQDEEFVVNFADKISFGLAPSVPFTSDANELKAALATASVSGKTALYDAVITALQRLDVRKASKKVLILISDGGDNASRHTFAQALRMAQSANVAIYTVGLFDENNADQNPNILEQLAKETGGLTYFPSTPADIVNVCGQIAGDIRHQYTIGYSPAGEQRHGYRKIRVNILAPNRGKLLVRTRAGYFLPSTKSPESNSAMGVTR